MNTSIHMMSTMVDILICMLIESIRTAMNKDAELQMLKAYVVRGWLHTKDEVQPCVDRQWLMRHELMMIGGIAMKGK